MAISLYELTVPSFLQTVDAIQGVLQKGLDHCRGTGTDPETLVETRLYPDMLPLRFQVVSVVKHSVGALECVKAGRFGRPPETPPFGYAGLQGHLAEASDKLKTYTADEINALEGGELVFQPGEHKTLFNAEGFLLSFSIPNFHFHAATAYDILRTQGVPLGKRDFLGRLRTK